MRMGEVSRIQERGQVKSVPEEKARGTGWEMKNDGQGVIRAHLRSMGMNSRPRPGEVKSWI